MENQAALIVNVTTQYDRDHVIKQFNIPATLVKHLHSMGAKFFASPQKDFRGAYGVYAQIGSNNRMYLKRTDYVFCTEGSGKVTMHMCSNAERAKKCMTQEDLETIVKFNAWADHFGFNIKCAVSADDVYAYGRQARRYVVIADGCIVTSLTFDGTPTSFLSRLGDYRKLATNPRTEEILITESMSAVALARSNLRPTTVKIRKVADNLPDGVSIPEEYLAPTYVYLFPMAKWGGNIVLEGVDLIEDYEHHLQTAQ